MLGPTARPVADRRQADASRTEPGWPARCRWPTACRCCSPRPVQPCGGGGCTRAGRAGGGVLEAPIAAHVRCRGGLRPGRTASRPGSGACIGPAPSRWAEVLRPSAPTRGAAIRLPAHAARAMAGRSAGLARERLTGGRRGRAAAAAGARSRTARSSRSGATASPAARRSRRSGWERAAGRPPSRSRPAPPRLRMRVFIR